MRKYNNAPLPFMGQKRLFIKQFYTVLSKLPEDIVVVDLFGGSGLLSHVAKQAKPRARVIYNDHDNYRQRLDNVDATNALISEIRGIVGIAPPKNQIQGDLKKQILECIKRCDDAGFVDYITLSSSLLFSGRYATSYDELIQEQLYNKIVSRSYAIDGYLDGIEVVSCDYKELLERYRWRQDVLLLVDPPYISTKTAHYEMSWSLTDYFDVVDLISNNPYIYFTSNKSMLPDFVKWVSERSNYIDPFAGATVYEVNGKINYNSRYVDMMICRV